MVAVLSFYLPLFLFSLFGWGFLPRPTGGFSLLERIQLVAAWALYALAWLLTALVFIHLLGVCGGVLLLLLFFALAVGVARQK